MSTSEQRIELIRNRIEEKISPEYLNIIDDSHLHIGHTGAKASGGGHFSIEVISDKFKEQPALDRHKMIYVALGDAMGTEIHALSIIAKTVEEAQMAKEEGK